MFIMMISGTLFTTYLCSFVELSYFCCKLIIQKADYSKCVKVSMQSSLLSFLFEEGPDVCKAFFIKTQINYFDFQEYPQL